MGNGSIGNHHVAYARHSSALRGTDSPRKGVVGVRWERVLRIRALLAQGAYNVPSASVADAILRRISTAA